MGNRSIPEWSKLVVDMICPGEVAYNSQVWLVQRWPKIDRSSGFNRMPQWACQLEEFFQRSPWSHPIACDTEHYGWYLVCGQFRQPERPITASRHTNALDKVTARTLALSTQTLSMDFPSSPNAAPSPADARITTSWSQGYRSCGLHIQAGQPPR